MLYPFMVTNIFHTSSSLPKLMALFISQVILYHVDHGLTIQQKKVMEVTLYAPIQNPLRYLGQVGSIAGASECPETTRRAARGGGRRH